MILANDIEPVEDDGKAADWQMIAIEDKMELAKMTDSQQRQLQQKLKPELSFEEANEILNWMDQFIVPIWRTQKEIINEIRKKIDSE